MPSSSTPRRSACDRCRRHKLRCARRNQTGAPCGRCSRLSVNCATSYTTKRSSTDDPGRPNPIKRVLKPKDDVEEHAQRTTCSVLALPVSMSGHTQASAAMNTREIGFSREGATALQSSRAYDATSSFMGTAPRYSVGNDHAIHPVNGNFEPGMSLHGFDDLVHLRSHSTNRPDSRPNNPGRTTDYLGNRESSHLWGSTVVISDEEPAAAEKPRGPFTSSDAELPSLLDCDHRLSNLSLTLSERLQQYEETSRCPSEANSPYLEAAISTVDGSKVPTESTLQSQKGQAESQTWDPKHAGNILSDTSDFLAIVQTYRQTLKSGAVASDLLSMIALLSLVSTYLQIATLYARLLQSLHRQLVDRAMSSWPSPCHNPCVMVDASLDEDQQILPGLQIGCFSVRQKNLQVRIFVDVIAHQFGAMESLLGVPDEYRVTARSAQGKANARQEVDKGLFGGDGRAIVLFRMINDQDHGDPRLYAQRVVASKHGGSSVLSFVGRMIDKIQSLIEQ
ncbi:hypothetical protein F4780DRAFT_188209 [Xylariomycetidae sp. FL0641]|nr:hypothetical protein F4780DRAFT_188209 [Xylariomycetidae sp. FL0641]